MCGIYPIRSDIKKIYQNINYIHPIKQKKIEELLDYIEEKYPSIKQVIVFGSTVDGRCNFNSDIDLVIVGLNTDYFEPLDNDSYDVLKAEDIINGSYLQRVISRDGVSVFGQNKIPEGRIFVNKDFLFMAQKDLLYSDVLMGSSTKEYIFDGIAFHTQQSIEKIIKQVLLFEGMELEKIHSVYSLVKKSKILKDIIGYEDFNELLDLLDSIECWAVKVRYDVNYSANEDKVRQANSLAHRIFQSVNNWLDNYTASSEVESNNVFNKSLNKMEFK